MPRFSIKICGAMMFSMVFLLVSYPVKVFADSTYIIDTPTKGMLEYGDYNIDFRFFSGGGILSKLNFGVFRIVNLGIGLEVNEVIGTQSATSAPPSLYIKIRPFTGGMVLPAFAFGYDGQGYYYNKDTNEFNQKEKGIFFVFGRELFFPGLNFNAGMNMNDFKENKIYGFTSFEFEVEEKFMIIGEYDNINYFPDARLNAGLRLFITDDVSIDVAGRDMMSSERKAERIAKIGYSGRF